MPPSRPTFEQTDARRVKLAAVDERAEVELVEQDDAGEKRLKCHSQKWAGRAWLSVVPRGMKLKKKAWKLSSAKDALDIDCEGKKGKNKVRGETHRFETGSLKWSVIYGAASDLPDEPHVTFDVGNPPGLTFHYQPPLTLKEIAQGVQRPDEIIGSYAVYWPESGRILCPDGTERVNFETGKYCHISRPKWIDASGNWTWGEQTIVGTELRVALPTAWLARASWPVTLDPTFGYGTAGASRYPESNRINAQRYTPATNGTLDSISVYAQTYSTYYYAVTLGLYSDATGPKPETLLVDTDGFSVNTTAQWWTRNTDSNPAISAGTYYWIAQWGDAPYFYYDSVTQLYYYYGPTYSAGSMPSSWGGTSNQSNGKWSMYATYTESSSTSMPVMMAQYRQRRR